MQASTQARKPDFPLSRAVHGTAPTGAVQRAPPEACGPRRPLFSWNAATRQLTRRGAFGSVSYTLPREEAHLRHAALLVGASR